jgi:hypothetical protein
MTMPALGRFWMTVGEVRMDGNMHTFILVKRVVNVSRTSTATARSACKCPFTPAMSQGWVSTVKRSLLFLLTFIDSENCSKS